MLQRLQGVLQWCTWGSHTNPHALGVVRTGRYQEATTENVNFHCFILCPSKYDSCRVSSYCYSKDSSVRVGLAFILSVFLLVTWKSPWSHCIRMSFKSCALMFYLGYALLLGRQFELHSRTFSLSSTISRWRLTTDDWRIAASRCRAAYHLIRKSTRSLPFDRNCFSLYSLQPIENTSWTK